MLMSRWIVRVGMMLLAVMLVVTGSAVIVGRLEHAYTLRRELAYVQQQGLTTRLILQDTNRGVPIVLMSLPRAAEVAGNSGGSDLYWSPDGEKLAFIQENANGSSELVVIDLATLSHTGRTISGLGGRLSWTSDSRTLTYSRFGFPDRWNIYTIEVTLLTEALIDDTPPLIQRGRNSFNGLWSPDGRILAYQTGDVSDYPRSLLLQVEDQPPHPVTRPPFTVVGGLAFSPDSTRLIFTGIPLQTEQGILAPPVHLYVVDVERPRSFASIPLFHAEPKLLSANPGAVSASAWSPDGTQIAFVASDESETALYIVDSDRAEVLPVGVKLPGEVSSLSWSPDQTYLALGGSKVGGLSDLYLYTPDTQTLQPLLTSPLRENAPVWRPEG